MKENENTILKLVCKWRTELMGIAILWVVLFHAGFQFRGVLDTIQAIGYGGVDIFFLLSGIGLYYSLQKSEDLIPFYKRRARRLFPSYLPFILVWCIYMLHGSEWSADTMARIVAGNFFMTGWIADIGVQFNWYVQVIFWVYLLTPLFYKVITATSKRWQRIVLLFWSLLLGIAFWYDDNHLMGVSRLPIFLMGMMWAYECTIRSGQEAVAEKTAKRKFWQKGGILVFLFLIGMGILLSCYYSLQKETMWGFGLWWYPFLLIAPGMCFLLCLLFEGIEQIKGVKRLLKPLRLIGKASFEIYLIHLATFEIVPQYIWVTLNKRWLVLVIASILVGIAYHLLVEGVQKIVENHNKKVQNERQ